MTFTVGLTPNARRDRDRILSWYDGETPEQTERFLHEFFAAAHRLEDFPFAGPIVRSQVRRVSLRVFPYHLWYRVHEDTDFVQVLAIIHHRQDSSRFEDQFE